MARIKVVGFPDADNVESFTVQNGGVDYNLDTNGVTKVEVYTCEGNAELVPESSRIISSDTEAVSWTGATLKVMFGKLGLAPGNYRPKVRIYSPLTDDGVIIAGPGLATELALTMSC